MPFLHKNIRSTQGFFYFLIYSIFKSISEEKKRQKKSLREVIHFLRTL